MEIGRFLKEIPGNILDVFFPAFCFKCRELLKGNRKIICAQCYESLQKINKEQLKVFNSRIPQKYFDGITIIFEFSELFQQIMYYYKYQGYKEIAEYFAKTLKQIIHDKYDSVGFVPLHKSKERERGFNQSQIIAEQFSRISGNSYDPNLLKRTRYTLSQTKLKRSKRHENVKNAFISEKDPAGKTILLIDDVITTGATLNECAKILKEGKAEKVDIAAMATPVSLLQIKLEADESDGLISR